MSDPISQFVTDPINRVTEYLKARVESTLNYEAPYDAGPQYLEPTGPVEVLQNVGIDAGAIAHGMKSMEALGNARVGDTIPSIGAQAYDIANNYAPEMLRETAAAYDTESEPGKIVRSISPPADYLLRTIKYGMQVDPENPAQFYGGQDYGLFREGDTQNVGDALWKGFIEDPADKYIHPALQGDWGTFGRNVGKQPLSAAIDAASLPLPPLKLLRGLPGLSGALKAGSKGMETAKAGLKSAGKAALDKLPAEGFGANLQRYIDNRVADDLLKDLDKMPDDMVADFAGHRAYIERLHEQVPPQYRDKLAALGERTALDDPVVQEMAKHPAVQKYLAAIDQINEAQFARAQRAGLLAPEAHDATRIVPELKAKFARGEMTLVEGSTPQRILSGRDKRANALGPQMGLKTRDFSAEKGNQMLNSLVKAIDELQSPGATLGDPMAVTKGTYFPKVKPGELDAYFSRKMTDPMTDPRGAEMTEGALTTRAEAYHYRPNTDNVPVAGERSAKDSFDSAAGHIQRYEIVERALRIQDWFKKQMGRSDITPATKGAVASRLSDIVVPMMRKAGLNEQSILEQLEQFRLIEETVPMIQRVRDGIRQVLDAEITGKAYDLAVKGPAAVQRRLATQLNFLFAPLNALQSATFIALTQVNGAQSLFNTLLSLKIATSPKAFKHLIPREILEGQPFGRDKSVLMKALNINGIASNKVQDVARAVMWGNAVQRDMKMLKNAKDRNIFMRVLNWNGELEQAMRDLGQFRRGMEGQWRSGRDLYSMGRSASDWGAKFKEIERLTDNIVGNYRRNWKGWGRLAKDTILWPEVLLQVLTASHHMMRHNRLKTKTLKDLAVAVGDYQQQQEGMKEQDPWAYTSGGIYSDRPAPDGTHNITPARSIIGLDMGLDLVGLVSHALFPDVPGFKPGDTDMHVWAKAALLAAGVMPGTDDMRRIKSPANIEAEGNQHRLQDVQNAPDLVSEVDRKKSPFENLRQGAFTIGGLSFAPGFWNYLKQLDGRIVNPHDVIEAIVLNRGSSVPSDVSVPRFIPGDTQGTDWRPKTIDDTGELEQPNAATWLNLLPGGNKIMPTQARDRDNAYEHAEQYDEKVQKRALDVEDYLQGLKDMLSSGEY